VSRCTSYNKQNY